MRILFILQIFAILASPALSLKLFCDFETHPNTCKVTEVQVSSSSDQTVSNVYGRFRAGKFVNDVTVIDARNHLIARFPLNLSKFLPNIETVFFEKGMTEIHKEELAQYPNLKELYLSTNELKVIEPDLFINNRELKLIFLNANKIKSVATNVFDGLTKLTYLGFDANVCHSGQVENNHEGAKELAQNIYKNCATSMSSRSGFGSESCVAKKDFDDFRMELLIKLEEWKKEILGYVHKNCTGKLRN